MKVGMAKVVRGKASGGEEGERKIEGGDEDTSNVNSGENINKEGGGGS